MSTPESPKAVSQRFLEAIDRQDWSAALELTTASSRARLNGRDMDRDGWLGMGQMFSAAFPDGKHHVTSTVSEGDRVVLIGTWTGTHREDFMGVPASGRPVSVDMVIVDRVVEGRIVEHSGVFDTLGLMQQIGAIPGPG